MIANLIGGFVAIIIGVSLVGPVSVVVNQTSSSTNATGGACTASEVSSSGYCQLYLASGWGATVLKLVPGFFALGILGIGIAVTYSALREAGII